MTPLLFTVGMYGAALLQIAHFKRLHWGWFTLVSFFIFYAAFYPVGIFFTPLLVVLLLFLHFDNLKIHIKTFTFLSQLSVGLVAGYLLLGMSLAFALIAVLYVATLFVFYKAHVSVMHRLILYLVYAASVTMTFWYLVSYQDLAFLQNSSQPYDQILAFMAGWTLFFYFFYMGILLLALVGGKKGMGITVLYKVLPDYLETLHFKSVKKVIGISVLSLLSLITLQFFGTTFLLAMSTVLLFASYLDEQGWWLHK